MSLSTKLSYFSTQDGNAMNLEEKIHQLVLNEAWPIVLTSEEDEELESCSDEEELRAALKRREIL